VQSGVEASGLVLDGGEAAMAGLIDWTSRRLTAAAPECTPAQMVFTIVKLRSLHVALCLQTERDPSVAEWSSGCQAFRELRKQCGDNTASLRTLIISDGGAPNTLQRAEFFQAALGGLHPTAVISISLSNPVKRGIATAISWLNPHFRAFEPQRWSDAFGYLDLSRHFDAVWGEFAKLQQRLPRNLTLRSITVARRVRSAALVPQRVVDEGRREWRV
jgi:hypothetical protein